MKTKVHVVLEQNRMNIIVMRFILEFDTENIIDHVKIT
jgi:hypothetical protein